MSDRSDARDATKIAFRGRARWGSPFVARVPGRPGESGYDPSGQKLMSLVLLVPKTETAMVARIQAAGNAAAEESWASKRPVSLRLPWSDGDERKSDGTYVYPGEEFRGQLVVRMRAKEERMPVVMKGPAGEQVQAFPRDYAPGYWLTVVCRAFTYNRSGNSGMSFGCNAVNITAEDDVFASDEPISDLDAALSGADLPTASASTKAPPPGGDNPASQFA
jgi:hypothetical protein